MDPDHISGGSGECCLGLFRLCGSRFWPKPVADRRTSSYSHPESNAYGGSDISLPVQSRCSSPDPASNLYSPSSNCTAHFRASGAGGWDRVSAHPGYHRPVGDWSLWSGDLPSKGYWYKVVTRFDKKTPRGFEYPRGVYVILNNFSSNRRLSCSRVRNSLPYERSARIHKMPPHWDYRS